MSFSRWLRSNSEHYLLRAAQMRIAEKNGISTAIEGSGFKGLFWTYVFVPVYRVLPASLRQLAFRAMPGSHRRSWPKRGPRPRPPANLSLTRDS